MEPVVNVITLGGGGADSVGKSQGGPGDQLSGPVSLSRGEGARTDPRVSSLGRCMPSRGR